MERKKHDEGLIKDGERWVPMLKQSRLRGWLDKDFYIKRWTWILTDAGNFLNAEGHDECVIFTIVPC